MLVAAKKKYETPRLEQLATQQGMQKHRVHEIKSEDGEFDEMGDVNELLAEFGSPLYIVSEKAVRTLYRSFRDAFTAPGIDTIIAGRVCHLPTRRRMGRSGLRHGVRLGPLAQCARPPNHLQRPL